MLHWVESAVYAFHSVTTHASEGACPWCRRPAATDPFFEGMHRVCFHYTYEHDGDPDTDCGRNCPSRALDA